VSQYYDGLVPRKSPFIFLLLPIVYLLIFNQVTHQPIANLFPCHARIGLKTPLAVLKMPGMQECLKLDVASARVQVTRIKKLLLFTQVIYENMCISV